MLQPNGVIPGANATVRSRLGDSDDLFRVAFENAPIGMILASPDLTSMHVNRALCEMLGYSEEELLAGGIWAFTHPEDIAQNLAYIQRALAGEIDSYEMEKRYLHRDGHIVWGHLSGSLVRDPSGAPRYFVSQIQDITTRKAADEALAVSEERFRLAFENASIGMALVAADQRPLQVNRALCAMLGYTEDELLGTTLRALTHLDDLAVNQAFVERALAGELDSYSLEKRYLRRDGQSVWASLTASIVRDDTGAPLYFISQIQDISARKAAEAELAETQHGTRQVLERITDAFYTLDRDWRFAYINAAAERVFDRPREEMLGKDIWTEFASALETPVYAAYQWAMAEGTAIELEFFYPAFNAWYLVNAYPSDDGLSVFFRDVTEQRRLIQDLRTSEARYRILVEHLPAVVYEQANDDRQTSTYFSPRFATLTGYSMEEIMDQPPGEHWHDFLHPDDQERVATDEARSLETSEPFRSEYRLRRRDGSYVWVRDECVPVHDETGNLVAWQGVLLDITDRILAEQAFAASELRFRTAFENAPIGMALTSPQLGVLQVNRALCAMLGYDAEEIIDQSLRGLTHPDDIAANQQLIERVLAGETDSFELEKRYVHKDGQTVWALLRVSLVRDERGEPDYFISQTQDITAKKQAEAALRAALDAAQAASQAKSAFLATMSHELRTPLQAVMGYAEFLLSGAGGTLTAEQREDIGYIHQGGKRMMALIAQMLDLSRIEAGALHISRTPVDLRTILEEVRQDVALLAEEKGLELTFEAPATLPHVLADALRLHQILLNLVSNAVKFTERGWVRVVAVAGESGVTVTVRDTGIGIAPEALPHIFEEFRQGDSTLARRHGGAGLGLAIAQKLAGLMGCQISVESEVGIGSTFSLHLDAAPAAGAP